MNSKPQTAVTVPENKDHTRDVTLQLFNEVYLKKLQTIKAMVPEHMSADRVARMIYVAFDQVPKLKVCSPLSICNAVVNAATCGLEFNTPLEHGWLIPYQTECKFIPGYKGLIAVACRNPSVASVTAGMVCENDEFSFVEGSHPQLEHVIELRGERGEWYCAWCVVHHDVGPPRIFVMRRDDIEKIRDESLAKIKEKWKREKAPWIKHPESMRIKTAVRHGIKLEPTSSEQLSRTLQVAADLDDGLKQEEFVTPADAPDIDEAILIEGSGAAKLPEYSSKEDAQSAQDEVLAQRLKSNIESFLTSMLMEKKRLIEFERADGAGENEYYRILRAYGVEHANDQKFMTSGDASGVWVVTKEGTDCFKKVRKTAREWGKVPSPEVRTGVTR